MVKIYSLTAMLEIFDRLLSNFGQDAFDSLYWRTRNKPEVIPIISSFLIVMCYVIVHSCLYFYQIATLTVAINSSDQAIIAVLVLNNFTEIKAFVFKKFDAQNLFQLACSDITERFQLTLFMIIIVIVGVAQAGYTWIETIPSYLSIVCYMTACEAFADYIKHAYIIKFNLINANVYSDYSQRLRTDVLIGHKNQLLLDHTYATSRRLGLSQSLVIINYV